MIFPKAVGDLEIRETGDEVLVHDPLHDKVHVLNRTAGFVLALCDGTRTAGEIAHSLGAAFGTAGPDVGGDVERIIDDFAAAELIETAKPAPPP